MDDLREYSEELIGDEADSMEVDTDVRDIDPVAREQLESLWRDQGIGPDGTLDINWPPPGEEVDPDLGGGMRISRRLRINEKRDTILNLTRKQMIYIIKKIRIWDTNIINLDSTDIAAHTLNEQLKGSSSISKDAGIYTFYEWLLYSNSEKNMTIKSKIIEKAEQQLLLPPVPLSARDASLRFIKNIETEIKNIQEPGDFKNFVSDILKFIKYTTVPGFFGDIRTKSETLSLINPKTTINITSFVKKKWRSLTGSDFTTYLKTLLGRKKISLTTVQMEQIDRLRNDIMNWWIANIYYGSGDPSGDYAWERDWIDIIRGSTNITDEKLVDFFISQELKPRKGSSNNRGIFTGLNDTVERVKSKDETITNKMLSISDDAYKSGAIGNNVAAISHYYSESKNKPNWPSNIGGFLFEKKDQYNCNSVNVADPGSTCPRINTGGIITTNISLNVNSDQRISFKIESESGVLKNDLSNGICEYSIKLPNGGSTLTGTTSTAKGAGLSKINILKKVMKYIKNQATQDQSQPPITKNSDALNYYITNLKQYSEKIKEIIQIFSLKLFGDFGQELFSVEQSISKPTVFVGNDWISSIRYLFLKKHVVGSKTSKHPWWGGFMGNVSCFLFYHQGWIIPSSRPVSPVGQPGGGGKGDNSMKLLGGRKSRGRKLRTKSKKKGRKLRTKKKSRGRKLRTKSKKKR
jgi:hypothetical protein